MLCIAQLGLLSLVSLCLSLERFLSLYIAPLGFAFRCGQKNAGVRRRNGLLLLLLGIGEVVYWPIRVITFDEVVGGFFLVCSAASICIGFLVDEDR